MDWKTSDGNLGVVEGLVSLREAATRLRVSRQRARQLALTGRLVAVGSSVGFLVDPDGVEQLARCRERKKREAT